MHSGGAGGYPFRMFLPRVTLLVALIPVLLAQPVSAAVTAFRFSDLDLRDPHLFVSFIGCRDFTDTQLAGYSFNGQLQTHIQTDGDGDGKLDENFVLVFDPVDPSASTSQLIYESALSCTAPLASTTCDGNTGVAIPLTVTQQAGGTCLAALAGTTRPYTPAITSSSAPCFVTAPFALAMQVGGIPLPLTSVQIGGTFSGSPTDHLVNGLMRGFLSQADADATILPASLPLVGGQPLSKMLAGGTGACPTYSDKDVNGGVSGWWFYFNFSAVAVPYTGPTLDVPLDAPAASGLEVSPNPAHGRVEFRFTLASAAPARLAIFDLFGRRVREVATGGGSGLQRVTWDGRRDGGEPAAPGLYLARVGDGGLALTRRFLLVR